MKTLKMTVIPLLFLSTLFTGCTICDNPQPEIKVIHDTKYIEKRPPKEFLYCKDLKVEKEFDKQSDVARILINTKDAYDDCKMKINKIGTYYK